MGKKTTEDAAMSKLEARLGQLCDQLADPEQEADGWQVLAAVAVRQLAKLAGEVEGLKQRLDKLPEALAALAAAGDAQVQALATLTVELKNHGGLVDDLIAELQAMQDGGKGEPEPEQGAG